MTNLRTAYPTFERVLARSGGNNEHLPSSDEIVWAQTIARGQRQILSLIVLLKCSQTMGYVPSLMAVPEEIVRPIAIHLAMIGVISVADLKLTPLSRRALYSPDGYQAAIRHRLGLRAFGAEAQAELKSHLTRATQTQHSTIDLINAAVEWLWREKIELLGFDRLRRICGQVNTASHHSIERQVMSRVDKSLRDQLDTLLKPVPGQIFADWIRIRERPGAPTLHALREYLDFADWVWDLGNLDPIVTDVPIPKLRHYSAEAMELAASDLLNFGDTESGPLGQWH